MDRIRNSAVLCAVTFADEPYKSLKCLPQALTILSFAEEIKVKRPAKKNVHLNFWNIFFIFILIWIPFVRIMADTDFLLWGSLRKYIGRYLPYLLMYYGEFVGTTGALKNRFEKVPVTYLSFLGPVWLDFILMLIGITFMRV